MKGVTSNLQIWDQIKDAIEVAKNKAAKVGVFGARGGSKEADEATGLTVLEVATIHAFGSEKANIPQRDFINDTLRIKRGEIFDVQRKAMKGVILRRFPAATGLEIIGQKVQAEMKNVISEGTHLASLSLATIKAKGSSTPLVDTGQLLNAITYEVGE